MSKRTHQAHVAVRMCRSWRGHDFDVVNGARSSVGRYAKDVTVRAERRLNAAIEAEAAEQAEEDWQDYLAADDEGRAWFEEHHPLFSVRLAPQEGKVPS